MNYPRPAPAMNKNVMAYQRSQIMSMDPVSLLIKVYDFTILHCKKKDLQRAGKGLVELMSALNFEHEEVSLGLFRLYQYCQDMIRKGEFDEAIRILEDLRGTWVEAAKKEKN